LFNSTTYSNSYNQVEIATGSTDGVNVYSFCAKIIEMEAMKQEIQASEIFEKLNTEKLKTAQWKL